MVAPYDLAVLWAVVVGAGTCTFPLILTFIGLRSRTPSGTAALSGFTQSAGLPAGRRRAVHGRRCCTTRPAAGPSPLWFLIACRCRMVVVGLYVARPAYVEDQLQVSGRRAHHERGRRREPGTRVERHRSLARAEHDPGEAVLVGVRRAGGDQPLADPAVAVARRRRSSWRGSPTGSAGRCPSSSGNGIRVNTSRLSMPTGSSAGVRQPGDPLVVLALEPRREARPRTSGRRPGGRRSPRSRRAAASRSRRGRRRSRRRTSVTSAPAVRPSAPAGRRARARSR